MSSENVINEIRESLNGRPGQPIVFGVVIRRCITEDMPSSHALSTVLLARFRLSKQVFG